MYRQHPPTYTSTGNPQEDFKHSGEVYETDLSAYLPADRTAPILDVGCGWGQCLWWLASKEYTNATGIDIGADQEANGRSLGHNVVRVDDPMTFLESHKSEFEIVLMNHVIEHVLPDEGLAILKAIRASLKPGGRLVVQTPNMNSIGANAGRYIEISHVTGYTESSLHQMMTLAGFSNVGFGSKTPVSFRPRRLAFIALQKMSRMIWKMMLLAELGTDSPRIIEKNLYASGVRKD